MQSLIAQLFTPTNDVIADIVTYTNAKDAAADFKTSIKARLDAEIQASELPVKEAVKALRAAMIEAGIDKRRVSEVLIDLGFKDEAKSKAAKAAKEEKAEAEAEELAPIIAELIALAETKAGEKAVKALRRAYLSAQGKAAGRE